MVIRRKHPVTGVALATALVLGLAATAVGGGTSASGGSGGGAPSDTGVATGHAKKLPAFVEKWQADKAAAADLVARGLAMPDANGIVTLKNGKPVQYRLQDTEQLTVVALDFADVTHNNIPQPDRSIDNSTYWTGDFNTQHYRDMLFSSGGGSYGFPSMKDFYLQQSSGRFTWEGQVSSWVQTNQTAADFGANSRQSGAGGDDLNGPVYRVVDAALGALAASDSNGGLDLSLVDQTDRYDCDGDGNFNEPDGYFDHFGIAHAGEGEEAGASPDTIWSHRWYANFNQTEGPEVPKSCKLGGYQLAGTDLWVGDYTIEPENGAVGVFAHEFGHDLGLPDLYDTSGGSENGTGFWTLMSSGSWASYATDSLDTAPTHMGSWEKLVLGWMDLGVAALGDDKTFELGPAETATRNRFQALRVNLPNYTKTTTLFPVDGSDPNYFYSGQGDVIDNTMSRTLTGPLAAGTPISFRANWDIETDWDYAYLRALVNGTWVNVSTSASSTTSPNGQNFDFGITGSSGGWVNVTATLPAGTTAYGFRYWTDGAVVEPGFAVDSIAFQGTTDDATSTIGWTFAGFSQVTNGQFTKSYFHYYLVESRSYIANDKSLCGAYNFLYGNWLEKQCYADGLLIWYRNSGYTDNNTYNHPGAGQILPIDAHPNVNLKPDGRTPWRTRWQMWDATFGVDTNSVTLSQYRGARKLSKTYTAPAVTTFYDSTPTAYWNSAIPYSSVKTAGSGLKIDIVGVSTDRGSYKVRVYR